MKYSMIHDSPFRSILFFTLPILGGMLLQQLYATVDGIIVGNWVSSLALGAVGTCTPVTSFLVSFATGFSSGFGVLFSQYFGAGEEEKMRRSWGTIRIIMAAAGVIFLLVGVLGGRAILVGLLQVPDSTLDMAVTYIRIYSLGMVFQMLYNAQAAALRSMGDSSSTLLFLVISTVVNIVLDTLFVRAFHWDVAGVAVATVIAQGISWAAASFYIHRRYAKLCGRPVFDRALAGLIARLGIPTAVQSSALSLGSLGLQRLVNSFGTDMMEAYAAATRIESFVTMPIISLNIGISTFTGQNLGAGQPERLRRGLRATLAMGAVSVAVIAAIVILLSQPLVGLFGCTGRALDLGCRYLVFMASTLIIFMVLFTYKGLLTGAGAVGLSTIVTVLSMVIRMIFAYSAARYVGERAVWYSIAVDFTLGCIPFVLYYYLGHWRDRALVDRG